MDYIEICGRMNGDITTGMYKVSYITALEYSPDNLNLTICYYGQMITYRFFKLEDLQMKAAEIKNAMLDFAKNRVKK